jgi:hypothetical protein
MINSAVKTALLAKFLQTCSLSKGCRAVVSDTQASVVARLRRFIEWFEPDRLVATNNKDW